MTGTPIRDTRRRSTARPPAQRWTSPPGERVLLIFGGSQAVRRFNAAVADALPRLVERVDVIHVTGDDGYAAALAGREALPDGRCAARYRPYPFLRDEMLAALAAADLVVGRAGSSTLAEVTALGLPMVVVPYPHAAGHQRANAASWSRPARRGSSTTRRSTPTALLDAAATPRRPGRARARCRPRPGRSAARAPPTRSPTSCWPRAERRRRCPDAADDRPPAPRGARRMIAAPSTRSRTGHRHPAPDRRQDVARRAARPVHDDARRRPGRPVRRRCTTCSSCARSSASRGRASCPHLVLGRGSDLVISDAGRPRPGHPGPRRGLAVDGERYTADAGVPMARAATETQRAGLSGLEFGLAIPGTVGGAVWANAGAHEADVAGVLESARVLGADGTEIGRAGRRPRARLPRQPAQARRPAGRPPRDSSSTRRSGSSRPTRDTIKARLDDIRRWRQAHQPLGLPSAGSVFRNPPGDSAGRLIDAAGPQGPADRRRRRVREARQLHRQRPEGHRRRRAPPGRPRPRRGRSRGTASSSRSRSSSSATGPAGRRRGMTARAGPPVVVLLGGPSAEHDVSLVSGTAIADALAGAGHPVEQVAHRPRRPLVVAAGGPSPRRPARSRLRRPGRARRRRAARGGAALDRLAGADPAPVVVHRPPRAVRRGRHGPGAARGGRPGLHGLGRRGVGASAWTRRCSSGCAAGIGLPVVDWREVRAARWAADRDAVLGGARGVRRRRRRPAADGQAGPARQLGRDDPRPRPGGARRRRSTSPSATTRWPSSRPTSPAPATSRSSVIGNDPAGLELYGPGEIVSGPRVLRLRRQVHAGPVRDVDAAPRSADASAPIAPQDRARRLPGDRRRGLRAGRLPAGRRARSYLSEINTIPGFTPDQPVPDAAGRGRLHFADVCARIVELAARAPRGAGRPRGSTPADLPR